MKMTIVIDSDDREGINDALKMVRIAHHALTTQKSIPTLRLVFQVIEKSY